MSASGPQADHRPSAPKDEQRRPARTRRSRVAVGTPVPVEPATSAAAGTDDAPAEVLPRLLKVFGAIVAPTTLLTGLLFYFGRLHITGFFRYFRVNFTVLDLTVNDYLIRSADGLFRPVGAVTVFGLMALWLNRVLVERLQPGMRHKALRFLVPGLAVAGLLLLGVAVADLLGPGDLIASYPEAGGLGLAGGVLLPAYAAHLSRTFRPRTGALSHRVAEPTRLAERVLREIATYASRRR